jgi:hypothetical protein
MKAKGILIIAVACFVLVGLAVLKEDARSDDPAPNPALYGITHVENVAKNWVLVKYTIQHGDYDETYSGYGQQDGEYQVGGSSDWGTWCLWATYTRNDSSFLGCVQGYRQQYSASPDEVDIYLVYSTHPICPCWPQEPAD